MTLSNKNKRKKYFISIIYLRGLNLAKVIWIPLKKRNFQITKKLLQD